MSNWQLRPDLNFCDSCWWNARIEVKEREIGIHYLCHSCGMMGDLTDGDAPRSMTDEQFAVWHPQYVNNKYGNDDFQKWLDARTK
jgi:hypothetical protein